MAQHRYRQSEWPIWRQERDPEGYYVCPDGIWRGSRSLVGPLRHGTAAHDNVGPRGGAVYASDTRRSDMGMDRISPRGFDPMGTALERYGPQPGSDLIAGEIRGRRTRR